MSLRAIVKEVIREELAIDAPPKMETAFDIEEAITRFVDDRAQEFPDEALHLVYWLRAFLSKIPEPSAEPVTSGPVASEKVAQETKPDSGWLEIKDKPTVAAPTVPPASSDPYFLPTDQIETLTSPTEEMIQ